MGNVLQSSRNCYTNLEITPTFPHENNLYTFVYNLNLRDLSKKGNLILFLPLTCSTNCIYKRMNSINLNYKTL